MQRVATVASVKALIVVSMLHCSTVRQYLRLTALELWLHNTDTVESA